jgi:hypothetical protein
MVSAPNTKNSMLTCKRDVQGTAIKKFKEKPTCPSYSIVANMLSTNEKGKEKLDPADKE